MSATKESMRKRKPGRHRATAKQSLGKYNLLVISICYLLLTEIISVFGEIKKEFEKKDSFRKSNRRFLYYLKKFT